MHRILNQDMEQMRLQQKIEAQKKILENQEKSAKRLQHFNEYQLKGDHLLRKLQNLRFSLVLKLKSESSEQANAKQQPNDEPLPKFLTFSSSHSIKLGPESKQQPVQMNLMRKFRKKSKSIHLADDDSDCMNDDHEYNSPHQLK